MFRNLPLSELGRLFTLFSIVSIRNSFSVRAARLTVFWLLGLLTGAFVLSQTSIASLMCSVSFPRISIIGLFAAQVIPFLISYVLLRFLPFNFILLFAFFKAFSFICCYGAFMIHYGDAGWLISGMVLFSDFFLVVLLLFDWFNFAAGEKYWLRSGSFFHILFLTLIGLFDYIVVSPFSAMLLHY